MVILATRVAISLSKLLAGIFVMVKTTKTAFGHAEPVFSIRPPSASVGIEAQDSCCSSILRIPRLILS
jgi:hypothetical protein